MERPFDPYHTWLGIPPERQPADHYRLLGLELFESNREVIANALDQRMSHVREAQTGRRADYAHALLNELAAAGNCLLDDDERRAYDEQLRSQVPGVRAAGGTGARPTAIASPPSAVAIPAAVAIPVAGAIPAAVAIPLAGAIPVAPVVPATMATPVELPVAIPVRPRLAVKLTGRTRWILVAGGLIVGLLGLVSLIVNRGGNDESSVASQEHAVASAVSSGVSSGVVAPESSPTPQPSATSPVEAEPSPSVDSAQSTPREPDRAEAEGAAPAGATTLSPGGHALRFEVWDAVEFENTASIDWTGPLTIELWLRCAAEGTQGTILGNFDGNPLALESSWQLRYDQGQLAFSSTKTLAPGASLTLDTSWRHLVLQHDPGASTTSVFLDGRFVSRQSLPGLSRGVAANLELGVDRIRWSRHSAAWRGDVGGLRISEGLVYSTDFVPARTFTREPRTLLLADFEHPRAGWIEDRSGRDHHGRLHGVEWIPCDQAPLERTERVRQESDANALASLLAFEAPLGSRALRMQCDSEIELLDSESLLNFSRSFTAEFWVREAPGGNQAAPHSLLTNTIAGPTNRLNRLAGSLLSVMAVDETKRRFGLECPTLGFSYDLPATDGWTHWAFCHDAERRVFLSFVNGRFAASLTLPTAFVIPVSGPRRNWRIGRTHYTADSPADGFEGELAAFRLSSKPVYLQEFRPTWRLERTADTLVLLDFEHSAGEQITDLAGDHHGRLKGVVWTIVESPPADTDAAPSAEDVPTTPSPDPASSAPASPAPATARLDDAAGGTHPVPISHWAPKSEPAPIPRGSPGPIYSARRGAQALRMLWGSSIEIDSAPGWVRWARPVTIEFWLRRPIKSTQRRWSILHDLEWDAATGTSRGWSLGGIGEERLELIADQRSYSVRLPSSTAEWEHFAIVGDAERLQFYVDGAPATPMPFVAPAPSRRPLVVGSCAPGSPYDSVLGDLGMLRISSVQRYDSAFRPSWDWPIDKDTELQCDFTNLEPDTNSFKDFSQRGRSGKIERGERVKRNEEPVWGITYGRGPLPILEESHWLTPVAPRGALYPRPPFGETLRAEQEKLRGRLKGLATRPGFAEQRKRVDRLLEWFEDSGGGDAGFVLLDQARQWATELPDQPLVYQLANLAEGMYAFDASAWRIDVLEALDEAADQYLVMNVPGMSATRKRMEVVNAACQVAEESLRRGNHGDATRAADLAGALAKRVTLRATSDYERVLDLVRRVGAAAAPR